jgi:chorismate synthase
VSGNTFGRLFSVTTFGESHGSALGCIVDGCPPDMELSEADIQPDVDRRRTGTSRHTSQRHEADAVKILSGVFEGRTTGTPIGLLIENTDAKSKDYETIQDKFRPGHADYTYLMKYGRRDHRGGGRASARETVMRVAAGAIARKYLRERYGVVIHGWLAELGPLKLEVKDLAAVDGNSFFCADPSRIAELESFVDALRKSGDSIGTRVTVSATGVPPGWGEPVFDKLDADLAQAMMGINAVKGVEIGSGFGVITQKGSEHRDEISPQGFMSNHAGGILGGISTGQEISVSLAIKPASSIRLEGKTLGVHGDPTVVSVHGRHDPVVGIRAVPIAEAMLALTLLDHALRHRAQNADVTPPLKPIPSAR